MMEQLTDKLAEFIEAQKVFFVATAPHEGRVNLSPKGYKDTFKILSPNRVAYLDLTGSGNETSAHLLQNRRITIMFCSFGDKPLILRLYGTGRAVQQSDADWPQFARHFPPHIGARQIMVIDVATVQTSCGYSIPVMEFAGERPVLNEWCERKGEDGIRKYWADNNMQSIDGLPTPLSTMQ